MFLITKVKTWKPKNSTLFNFQFSLPFFQVFSFVLILQFSSLLFLSLLFYFFAFFKSWRRVKGGGNDEQIKWHVKSWREEKIHWLEAVRKSSENRVNLMIFTFTLWNQIKDRLSTLTCFECVMSAYEGKEIVRIIFFFPNISSPCSFLKKWFLAPGMMCSRVRGEN